MAAPTDTFIRELELNCSKTLQIHQYEVGDVGCVVWDAAIVLSKYVETADFLSTDGHHLMNGKQVVELGAGTGVVGMVTAAYGARVVLTDLEEFVPLMAMNINVNKSRLLGTAVAQTLKWGSDCSSLQYPDYLLIADCIYYKESLEPLVKTIVDLAGPNTKVYCCYEERTTGDKPELQRKFFQQISEHFVVGEIPLIQQDPVFRSEDIHIMTLTKR